MKPLEAYFLQLMTVIVATMPSGYSGQKKKLNGPGVANKFLLIIVRRFKSMHFSTICNFQNEGLVWENQNKK